MEKKKVNKTTYTIGEVDAYLKKMMTASEVTLSEQKERISILKKEIDTLNAEKADLLQKNKMLSKAMTESSRLVKDFNRESSIKANLQIDKLKSFGYRWKSYLDDIFSKVPELRGNNSNIMFEQEIIELIDEFREASILKSDIKDKSIPLSKSTLDIDTKKWMAEENKQEKLEPKLTLSKDNEIKYQQMMTKLKDDMVYASELNKTTEDGFNIDEALNPKEDLKKILGDII